MTIRRVPEDFVVDELPHAAWRSSLAPGRTDATPNAVFELRKTSLTTPEATQRLAKALGLRGGEVVHAGLKDKHAITTQFVSAHVKNEPSNWGPSLSGPGWSAALVGWAAQEVDASIIDRNAFTIVVRDLSREANQRLNQSLRRVVNPAQPGRAAVLNYFGDQRFGSARHGGGLAGPLLCRGDYEGALRLLIGTPARKDTGTRRTLTRACATHWGDWKVIIANSQPHSERRAIETLAAGKSFRDAFAALPNFIQQLAVEAYQSSLWNRTVARMCRDAGLTKEAGKAIVADGICEELVFPDARALPSAWLGESVPMLAPDVSLRGPWAAAARAELAIDRLELDQLRLPGLRRPAFGTSLRPLVATADALEIDDAEADVFAPKRLARRVRFTLPRGAYATVLLMALGQ